jgi:hypothetical protein
MECSFMALHKVLLWPSMAEDQKFLTALGGGFPYDTITKVSVKLFVGHKEKSIYDPT